MGFLTLVPHICSLNRVWHSRVLDVGSQILDPRWNVPDGGSQVLGPESRIPVLTFLVCRKRAYIKTQSKKKDVLVIFILQEAKIAVYLTKTVLRRTSNAKFNMKKDELGRLSHGSICISIQRTKRDNIIHNDTQTAIFTGVLHEIFNLVFELTRSGNF